MGFRKQLAPKKNILKSNDFGVMQTVFFAFTCRFGLCLHVEKVVICINKTNWHPLLNVDNQMSLSCGQDEPLGCPENTFFSCVIGIYLVSFIFDHPVLRKLLSSMITITLILLTQKKLWKALFGLKTFEPFHTSEGYFLSMILLHSLVSEP